jgi:DNA-binding CsgD family transcriptional regulator
MIRCVQLPDPGPWSDLLNDMLHTQKSEGAPGARAGRWVVFACTFEDGSKDRIALYLQGSQHDAHCADILPAIWPIARQDVLREMLGSEPDGAGGTARLRSQFISDASGGSAQDMGQKAGPNTGADATDSPETGSGPAPDISEAMLWTISTKSDSAVLVLDEQGQLLESNAAGRDMLDAGTLLRCNGGTLRCADDSETRAFYAAVHSCVTDASPTTQGAQSGGRQAGGGQELIVFLHDSASDMRLPLSLSCYRCADTRRALVVAILPRQPDRTRIEMLAQKMGLSPCEARVAALIQLGLSNREAAHIAGLKEQTFNTYAKRVLSKLDVTGRTEMAQRLTWQASLGRAS